MSDNQPIISVSGLRGGAKPAGGLPVVAKDALTLHVEASQRQLRLSLLQGRGVGRLVDLEQNVTSGYRHAGPGAD